jgi:1-pyrroline-5-carboxylate dehydrogenase
MKYLKKQVFLMELSMWFWRCLMVTDTVLASRDFAGLHFTEFYSVYLKIFGQKLELTSTITKPTRIVGETGGKISSLHIKR